MRTALFLAAVSLSCGATQLCKPGDEKLCVGTGNCFGHQTCQSDANTWGACVCGARVGTGGHGTGGGATAGGGAGGGLGTGGGFEVCTPSNCFGGCCQSNQCIPF